MNTNTNVALSAYDALMDHVRAHGPVACTRASSAQSSTQYSYWGAVRAEIRLTKLGWLSLVSLERATSDRRSKLLACEDARRLALRERRVSVGRARLGRVSEEFAARVLAALQAGV